MAKAIRTTVRRVSATRKSDTIVGRSQAPAFTRYAALKELPLEQARAQALRSMYTDTSVRQVSF